MARSAAALLAAAAVAALTARAQKEAPYVPVMLQLSGACDFQWALNGLMFELRGYTANGSPYYKARARQEYLYYDPDCTGGGDGTARWILDQDQPSLTRWNDLDSDSSCEYRARINSLDGARPPYTGTWKMKCAQGWTDQFLTFLETTSTGTTSTTVTLTGSTLRPTTSLEGPDFVLRPGSGTGREVPPSGRPQLPVPGAGGAYAPAAPLPAWSPEGKPAAAPAPAAYPSNATGQGPAPYPGSAANGTANSTRTGSLGEAFTLSGACPEKGFLNGLLFKKQGTTASGAPYYRSSGTPQYIYYEPACDGNTESPQPRWVIDDDAPDPKALADLDKDGACDYHARLLSTDKSEPPAIATWRMYCAGSWADVQLVLERSKQAPAPQVIMVNGARGSAHYSAAAAALVLGAPLWRAGR